MLDPIPIDPAPGDAAATRTPQEPKPLTAVRGFRPRPAAGVPAAPRRLRVALYSHDTLGLGHRRRNLLVAHSLARPPLSASILIINGSAASAAFPLPLGADSFTLPALSKDEDGGYQSRSLDLSLDEIVKLRRESIGAALEAFRPDVFVVDNVPRGAVRELDPALRCLVRRGTRCVLGLRDVLDDAEAVRREWRRNANEAAIRDHYSAVWVYGDPAVYDAVEEYGFSGAVTGKLRYTGYLDHRVRLELGGCNGDPLARLRLPRGRLALCLVGGGQDGGLLAEAFARAPLPEGVNGVVVTGPFMPVEVQSRLRCLAEGRERLRILPFLTEPDWLLQRADRVVCMGGYNTVWEVLSFEKPALVVPRVRPRAEQLVRAGRLAELGLLEVLHPDRLSPEAIGAWLAREAAPPPPARRMVDMRGLERLPGLVSGLLSAAAAEAPRVAGACS